MLSNFCLDGEIVYSVVNVQAGAIKDLSNDREKVNSYPVKVAHAFLVGEK